MGTSGPRPLVPPLFAPAVMVIALGALIASDAWIVSPGRFDAAFADVLNHPVLLLLLTGGSARCCAA